MKRVLASSFLVLFAAAAPVHGASAQALANAPDAAFDGPETTGTVRPRPVTAAAPPATRGRYGGGFIELLMTGRDPSPTVQPLRPSPVERPVTVPMGDEYEDVDPMLQPRGRRPGRVAALPATPESGEPIGVPRALDPKFRRQTVDYGGPHAPGTIIIHTPSKFLYHVQAGGRAVRYGIGVGRPGFEWAGTKSVTLKREWPDWRPPVQMLRRRPDLPRFMAGGPGNPLGARALYLGSSLYRIHGTNEPHTIGQAVSSGCIRMLNEDVSDLYDKVRVGAKVVVI